MAITEKNSAFVDDAAASISLSQMFTVTAGASNPTYLVLSALDRNEYTVGASGSTGSLSGNGHTLGFSSFSEDERGAGIVFTYQASIGRYYNSTYGYLSQVTYTSSSSANDVTGLSLFGTDNLAQATAEASNPYSIMEGDGAGYLGTATVVTQPTFAGTVPAQATPNSIAAIADSFVGKTWNANGCWTLASTIAADAGAAVPAQSSLIDLAGEPSGEWFVAFNGPAGQTGNWQSMVKAGEMVVIGTPDGGGHVTTCVSGSGTSAMLVDNVAYVNSSGQVQNLANDGSSNDLTIAAAHAASAEWSGVAASSVVIYELDTPAVTADVASDSLQCLTSQAVAPLFTAADPEGKVITGWQIYDTATSDALVLAGTDFAAHSAADPMTVTSLAGISLLAGATATTDTLEVRAFNGSYWGDWTSLGVSVSPTVSDAPVLAAQTAAQTWTGGTAVSLALPSGTFTDSQGESLRYTATLSNGQALPTWLTFNPTTHTFSGAAPMTAQSLDVTVKATDTTGLAASETFAATVQPPAPVVTPGITVSTQTPNQNWTDGETVNLLLSPKTFTDTQGLKMTFAAYEVSGPNVTSWLSFNPVTDDLFGNVPPTASGTAQIEVIATDSRHLSATDLFSVTFGAAAGHAGTSAVTTSAPGLSALVPTPTTEMLMFHS